MSSKAHPTRCFEAGMRTPSIANRLTGVGVLPCGPTAVHSMQSIGAEPSERAAASQCEYFSCPSGLEPHFPPSLHGGWDAHRLAVFGDRPARDLDAGLLEHLDDDVIGKHALGVLPADHVAYAVANRFGRVLVLALARTDRRGEEVLELVGAARRRHVLVRRHSADRRFM